MEVVRGGEVKRRCDGVGCRGAVCGVGYRTRGRVGGSDAVAFCSNDAGPNVCGAVVGKVLLIVTGDGGGAEGCATTTLSVGATVGAGPEDEDADMVATRA